MKKIIGYVIIIVLCTFAFIPFVFAEEEEETTVATCDSIKLNELRKRAEKVTGVYEYVYDNNNNVIGFNYLIYNIPDDMYVTYTGMPSQIVDTMKKSDTVEIDPTTGIGKVFDSNIEDVYTIRFQVYQYSNECGTVLHSFTIKKLRYNKYSELEQCKYSGLEDFIYCQEWVNTSFPISEEEIVKRIESKIAKEKEKTTTECLSCIENQKNEDTYNRLVFIRKIVIFGLISGIIIDIVVIIYLFRKAGENRL